MGKFYLGAFRLAACYLVLSLGTPSGHAAAPPQRPLTLAVVMREWARANDTVRSMRYRFTQTHLDRIFGTKVVRQGEVWLLKPDLLRVDLNASEPGQRVRYLFTQDEFHVFFFGNKMEWVGPRLASSAWLEKTKPWRGTFFDRIARALNQDQVLLCWIYGGFPVSDLTRRFDVTIAKEDGWYVYLDMKPRDGEWLATFTLMRVVLCKEDFRVRQIWYEEHNGSSVTVDYAAKPERHAKITSENIRVGLPQGWDRVGPTKGPRTRDESPKK